jgi:hypothetical protein
VSLWPENSRDRSKASLVAPRRMSERSIGCRRTLGSIARVRGSRANLSRNAPIQTDTRIPAGLVYNSPHSLSVRPVRLRECRPIRLNVVGPGWSPGRVYNLDRLTLHPKWRCCRARSTTGHVSQRGAWNEWVSFFLDAFQTQAMDAYEAARELLPPRSVSECRACPP